MTTLSGRIGGQYNLSLVGEDKYRVQGRIAGNMVTMFTGEYALCSKVMDFAVLNDARAQTALQALFSEGDPTDMILFVDEALTSQIARSRRRVAMVVEIETDVLEGENSIALVNERMSAACQVAGVRVALIQASYIDPQEQGRMRDLGRIARQRDFLLDHFIQNADGTFTFPPECGGETFPCGKPHVKSEPQLVRHDLGDRLGQSTQPQGDAPNV